MPGKRLSSNRCTICFHNLLRCTIQAPEEALRYPLRVCALATNSLAVCNRCKNWTSCFEICQIHPSELLASPSPHLFYWVEIRRLRRQFQKLDLARTICLDAFSGTQEPFIITKNFPGGPVGFGVYLLQSAQKLPILNRLGPLKLVCLPGAVPEY